MLLRVQVESLQNQCDMLSRELAERQVEVQSLRNDYAVGSSTWKQQEQTLKAEVAGLKTETAQLQKQNEFLQNEVEKVAITEDPGGAWTSQNWEIKDIVFSENGQILDF